jgi:hypothetical protein
MQREQQQQTALLHCDLTMHKRSNIKVARIILEKAVDVAALCKDFFKADGNHRRGPKG